MDNDLIHINEDESKILESVQRGTMENPIDPSFYGLSAEDIQGLIDVDQDWKSGYGPESYPSAPQEKGLSSSLRPQLPPSEEKQLLDFQSEKDSMVAQNFAQAGFPTIKGEEGHFKAYDHRQLMTHIPNKMGPGAAASGPMGTSGMHYVDAKGDLSTGMRGEKTPAHISKNQDTRESFVASEKARNSMEQLRASLPRAVQDNLRGDMLLELADDGKYSLLVGDADSGYIELSYGPDDYQDALSDMKRAYNYAAHTGDARMDAGFLGRASSAYRYNGYTEALLLKTAEGRLSEVRSNPFANEDDVLRAMEEIDAMSDEVVRQRGGDQSRQLAFSRRALDREAKMRAAKMMQ